MPRLLRAAAPLALAVLGLVAAPPPPGGACSCAGPIRSQPLTELDIAGPAGADSARVVFDGTATARRDPNPGGSVVPPLWQLGSRSADPIVWTFAVDRVLAGTLGDLAEVVTPRDGASCGVSFALGTRYQVVARRGPVAPAAGAQVLPGDRLQTGLCAGNLPLPPLAGSAAQRPPASALPPAGPRAGLVGAGLLVVIGGIAAARRLRR